MRDKSLLYTNPYLKDPEKRKEIIKTVTVSSSSIEGVHAAAEQAIFRIVTTSKTRRPASVSSSKARR